MTLTLLTWLAVAAFPAFVALMSFICWQNGFRVLGIGYITRMTLVIVITAWGIYLTPGGAA